MKNRVSSTLFALAIFGGLSTASADDLTPVTASLTFDRALLTAEGAGLVLDGLEEQARVSCSTESNMTRIGTVVDRTCVKDIMFQAVNAIGDADLSAAYAGSKLYVEQVSDRFQLASNQ